MKANFILSGLLLISLCGFIQAQTSENDNEASAEENEASFPKFRNEDYSGFREWLEEHIAFPDDKQKRKFEKEPVSALFEIDGATGMVGNIEIVSYPDKKFAEHILTVIERSPNWAPASNGEAFRFYLQIDPFTRETILMPYILSTVDRTAVFQGGGMREFHRWVQFNISYPRGALKMNINGNVSVKFYVDIFGRPQLVTELSSPHPLLTQELARAIKRSPVWIPATMNGIRVPIPFTLSVGFNYYKGDPRDFLNL